eukprot:augustus_masked-scaffold_5-processed-gene-0.40-mRNA-1 protein AED:1.00 eAED:1.00 QI:0/-1/0/0/-1/1/1/0/843
MTKLNKPVLLATLLFTFYFFTSVNSVDINLGIFSSISGVNAIDGRTALPTFLTSAISLLAEINNLNQGFPSVPFQIENGFSSDEVVDEFTCDVTLVPYVVDTVGDFSEALANFAILNDNIELHGIIGSIRSSVTIPLSFVSSTDQIPIISFGATSPRLSDLNTHKFFSRTVISDAEIAQTYIDFLLDIEIKQAVVLYIEDDYGSAFKDALFSLSEPDDVDIEFQLMPYPADAGVAQIQDVVSKIKQTKLNVVLAICFDVDVVTIMEAAAKEDETTEEESWTGKGKLWVFTDGVASVDDVVNVFTSQNPNPTEEEKEFFARSFDGMFLLNQVAERESTRETISNHNERFDERLGWNEEQLEEIYNKLPGGLEYLFGEDDGDEFDASETFEDEEISSDMINFFGYFALDALLVFRNVIESLGTGDCDNIGNFTGTQFVEALQQVSNEGIKGITGDLEFDASGTRSLSSGAVQLVKMNLKVGDDGEFITSSEQQALYEGSVWNLSALEYIEGEKPNFTDPPDFIERNEIDESIVVAMRTLAGIGLVFVLALSLWVTKNQDYQIVAAAQPVYLLFTLFGVMILLISIFLTDQSLERYDAAENSLRCNLPYYLFSFGLTIVYTALFIKLQKIMKIYNTTEEDAKIISDDKRKDTYSSSGVLVIIFINITLLLVIVLLSRLEYTIRVAEEDEFGQPVETYGICLLKKDSIFAPFIALFVFHGALSVYGGVVVFQARNISSDFHDGFSVAMSIFVQVQLSTLAVPIMIAIGPEESTIFYLVQCLVVLLFCGILLALLFGEKIYRVAIGDTEVIWNDEKNVDAAPSSYPHSLSLEENVSQVSGHTMKTNAF